MNTVEFVDKRYQELKTLVTESLEVAGVIGAGTVVLGIVGYGRVERMFGAEAPIVCGLAFLPFVIGGIAYYLVVKTDDDDDESDNDTTVLPVNTPPQARILPSDDLVSPADPPPEPLDEGLDDFDMAHRFLNRLSYAVHCGFANGTGGGKTVMLSHLTDLARKRGEDLEIFDSKGGAKLGKWRDSQVWGAGNQFKEAEMGFRGLLSELQERQDWLNKHGNPRNGFPRLVIVIDEAQGFLKHPDCPSGIVLFEEMLRVGREVNISIFLSSQDFMAGTLGLHGKTELLNNLQYRVETKWDKNTSRGTFSVKNRDKKKEVLTFPLPLMECPTARIPQSNDYVSSRYPDTTVVGVAPATVDDEISTSTNYFTGDGHQNDTLIAQGQGQNDTDLSLFETAVDEPKLVDDNIKFVKFLMSSMDVLAGFEFDDRITIGQVKAIEYLSSEGISKNKIMDMVLVGGKCGRNSKLLNKILVVQGE